MLYVASISNEVPVIRNFLRICWNPQSRSVWRKRAPDYSC